MNDRRRELQRLAGRLAKRVGAWLKGRPELEHEDVCFAVLLFHSGPGGFSAYSSNAERLTMIRALREMSDQLARDPERGALYQIGSQVLDAAQAMDRKLRKRIEEPHERWGVAMRSYQAGLERFEESTKLLAQLPDKLPSAELESEENLRMARLTQTALIQMAAALVLACSYTPGIEEIEAVEIRASDEVH